MDEKTQGLVLTHHERQSNSLLAGMRDKELSPAEYYRALLAAGTTTPSSEV
jgi:hypothetical protein